MIYNFKDKIAAQNRIARAIREGKPRIQVEGFVVKLPSPQKTGNYTQQKAYSEQAAFNLVY